MKKTWLVLRHEVARTLRRPSFLVVSFGVPMVAVVVVAVLGLVKGSSDRPASVVPDPRPPRLVDEGFVDQAGLVKELPEGAAALHLSGYADEESARAALSSGKIAAYYVVPSDYVERGELYYVYPESRNLTVDGQPWLMRWTLLYNLLDGDAALADWIWNPVSLEVTSLSAAADTSGGGPSPAARLVPAIIVVLFYASFMINANLLSESVGIEKENRTIEVVLLSITPRQMLAGKVIGLGIAALLHTATWVGTAFLLLRWGGGTLSLPAGFTMQASVVWWGLAFFVLGFGIYASLMAGVGALAPKLKEASQASFLVLSPVMAGYVVGLLSSLAGETEGALLTALSLFPFTAPVVMPMRLAVGAVPWWHLALAAGLMAGTSAGIVRAVASVFRAQHLLSGQPFSVRRYVLALTGR